MNKPQNIFFTKEGFDNLKKEYQKLFESRPEAVKTLKVAREMGDLSENGFYKAARSKLSSIDYNLRRLNSLIKQAKVSEKPRQGIAGIGSKITFTDGKTTRSFTIVGRYESDPSENKISNASPIGRALVGKRIGEDVRINTPSGETVYKILEINNPS